MATFRVLINDTVKQHLLAAPAEERARLRKAFEFIENGLWDGGLRIKKLRGVSNKTVLEGRAGKSDRILLTLGRDDDDVLVYVWGVVAHDAVTKRARTVVPENAPFLNFTEYDTRDVSDPEIERLDSSCFTQERIEDRPAQDAGAQRWFVLEDAEWKRLLLYSAGDFEIFLFLTKEQRELLEKHPPLLLSGTAGSGKTTLCIYYLLRPGLAGKSRLMLTYNRHLKSFSERLYRSLVSSCGRADTHPPEFLTFRDLCARLVPDVETRFTPDREVDFNAFRELLARHKTAAKFDAALVWEEIRSIVKGAKPQIEAETLRGLLGRYRADIEEPGRDNALREEILAIRHTGLAEKSDSALRRIAGVGLSELPAQLETQLEKNRAPLMRALQAVVELMEKHEANFAAPLLTFAEYEQLGRKRAPVFLADRRDIYGIAEWYQGRLNAERLWDEIDLTRAAIRALDSGGIPPPRYDFVCCDEVQDLTDIQLSLLVRLPRNPQSLLLAGDPKQIVNPSGFRWEEAKKLFFERGLTVPPVHHLTLNFRCVGSIVLLANALLLLKQKLLGVQSDEKTDEWKFQGRPPFLVEALTEESFLEHVHITATERVILTRTASERDLLKERLGTELVFTIREAKGLEFKTVVLWKFCSEAGTGDLWAQIINMQTAGIHEQQIRHEINLLYVGITRAQQDLILFDGQRASAIWSSPLTADLIYRTSSLQFMDEAWHAASSPADWKRQGDYFFEHEHYRAAAECYRNADRPDLMSRAKALAHERRKELAAAADCWMAAGDERRAAENYEQADEPAKAQPIWERLGERQRAIECKIRALEKEKKYADAAEIWESVRRVELAIAAWMKAGRPDRAAPLYEKLKKNVEAAGCYHAARDFANAGRLYVRARKLEDAARCFEAAQGFAEAAAIWEKLRKRADLLRCLQRLDDQERLGGFYEAAGDWDRALESYRKATRPDLMRRFGREAEQAARGRRGHGRRALRLMLLGRAGEAANEWEKAGERARAASEHRACGQYRAAGVCFEQLKRYREAVEMFVRSVEDREAGYPRLMRCIAILKRRLAESREEVGLESIAKSLRDANENAGASVIFEQLRLHTDAALCAEAAGDLKRGLRLWYCARRYADVLRLARVTGEYAEGAVLLEEAAYREERRHGARRGVSKCLADLLIAWHAADTSDAASETIVGYISRDPMAFPPETVFSLLKDSGPYDLALMRATNELAFMPAAPKERLRAEWEQRARELEKSGDLTAAGFWYLVARSVEAAHRCWEQLQAADGNVTCLEAAGHGRRVVDYLERAGRVREAGVTLYRVGDKAGAAQFFIERRMHNEAALVLEWAGDYGRALDHYTLGSNARKRAEMLEKLRRWDDAARVYKSIGMQRKYEACMRKREKYEQRGLF